MNQSVRLAISDEASEWFVKNRDDSTTARERSAFATWLRTSPLHVEEYLAIASLAIELQESRDPAWSVEGVVAEAAAAEPISVIRIVGGIIREPARSRVKFWRLVAAAATIVLATTAAFILWTREGAMTERMATRHGEQRIFRLSDSSVLHLDTDTEVVVRYDRKKRLADLAHGRAMFEIVHDAARPFVVAAGSAEVRDLGTSFEVYRRGEATQVTVMSGEVSIAPSPSSAHGIRAPWSVRVHAGEQVQVSSGALASSPRLADLQRSTAWLRRQIAVDREPLAQVAADFNRYSSVPIIIETPALRDLPITGIFAADDTESFVAFLRSLDGVTVEVNSTGFDVRRP